MISQPPSISQIGTLALTAANSTVNTQTSSAANVPNSSPPHMSYGSYIAVQNFALPKVMCVTGLACKSWHQWRRQNDNDGDRMTMMATERQWWRQNDNDGDRTTMMATEWQWWRQNDNDGDRTTMMATERQWWRQNDNDGDRMPILQSLMWHLLVYEQPIDQLDPEDHKFSAIICDLCPVLYELWLILC